MQAAALASAQQDARNALEMLAGLKSVRESLEASKARVEEELQTEREVNASGCIGKCTARRKECAGEVGWLIGRVGENRWRRARLVSRRNCDKGWTNF